MIQKKRGIQTDILALERLLRRLHYGSPIRERVEGDLARKRAGLHGEEAFDYHLSLLPEDEVHIFEDLRLPISRSSYMQIDFLVITSRFYLIFEVKNIIGHLLFDSHQLIRTHHDKVEPFKDPVLQVRNHHLFLSLLLEEHGFPHLPGHPFVAVTSNSSIIEFSPDYPSARKAVIRPAKLPSLWKNLTQQYTTPIFSEKDLEKCARILKRLHSPHRASALQQYHLTIYDLEKGVFCRFCEISMVERVHGNWACPDCGFRDKDAHHPALLDYFLLVGDTASSRQLANFLRTDARTAARLLSKASFLHAGQNKGRRYQLTLEKVLD